MFTPEKSLLLVVDVQGKLAQIMYERGRVVAHIQAMIQAAKILKIPILWSEQAPDKIGDTILEVADLLKPLKPIVKTSFSCCQEKKFLEALSRSGRKEIIVVGIETHVCVYQTVSDLIRLKYEVQVVADAVSSRTAENKQYGLDRIRDIGGGITCTEMIVTELLQKAEGNSFRDILKLIK